MSVKSIEILEDPYTNNSDLYVLILAIFSIIIPTPSSPGLYYNTNGRLIDPNGNIVSNVITTAQYDYEVTGSLSNEAYAHSYVVKQPILIPPGWSFSNFASAIGLTGTLEELAPFIKGMS